MGWYGVGDAPAVYRSVSPAWSDSNLRDLAAHVESPLFLAHVRATTGTAIQQANCHPFRHGRWLFVHNGAIAGFQAMRRELMLAVDPELFADIEGTTDSEVLFHLALSLGLEEDPVGALERAIGLVEATAVRHGIEHPVQASMGLSDGERLWAFRYSTERRSRTLFMSHDAGAIKALHPENPRLGRLRDEDRVVVSEPLANLTGVWHKIPESTVLVVQPGEDLQLPFSPNYEAAATNGGSGMASPGART
jgi:glutamine amidotransferase